MLNTTRNIGQVRGSPSSGRYCKHAWPPTRPKGLAPLGFDRATSDRISDLAAQNLFDQILALVPANQLGALVGILNQAFVQALHNTFLVGAISCGMASLLALLLRNPQTAQATAQERESVTDSVERGEAAIADGTAYPA